MTIQLENGLAQWDWQIGTFRAEVDGVIHGNYTGEILTAQELADKLGTVFTDEQLAELEGEKQASEGGV